MKIISRCSTKKGMRTYGIINNCSYRRAKKITKGSQLRGTHKKKCVKWKSTFSSFSYSRKGRRLHVILHLEVE